MYIDLLSELTQRRTFFNRYAPKLPLGLRRRDVNAEEALKNSCPVCGYYTLDRRAAFEICYMCFWEDDGLDDFDVNEDSGPNHMTLYEGRVAFFKFREQFMEHIFPPDHVGSTLQKLWSELDDLILQDDMTLIGQITARLNEINTHLIKINKHILANLL